MSTLNLFNTYDLSFNGMLCLSVIIDDIYVDNMVLYSLFHIIVYRSMKNEIRLHYLSVDGNYIYSMTYSFREDILNIANKLLEDQL